MEVRRMFRFAIQRVLETIPVLILMSMLVFGLVLLLPGDPVLGMLGPGAQVDEETIARLRADLRLNDPIPVQYVAWMENVLQGDFGRSVTTKQPVLDAFASRLPVSAFLAGYAIVLMILIAVPLGTIAAVKRGTAWDLIASGISVFGLAVPGFWLAILLVMLFSIKLDILPSSGYVSPFEDPVQSLKYMFLPALALGAAGSGSLTRQLRSSLLEVLQEDYVRTARAKGLRGNSVLFRHAMRNALIPSVTVLGLSLGDLLGGSLIIESIFLVPGMGSLLVNAIFTRDFPVVQAGTLIIAVGVVIVNLGVDVLYGLLDPRIG
jgi:peptide/nickel transport system permease protein